MNFAQLNTTAEKQWLQLAAVVVLEIGPTTTKAWQSGDTSYMQKCKCRDGTGEVKTVTLQTNYPESLLLPTEANQPMDWKMKWYSGKHGSAIVGYPLKPQTMGGAVNVPPPPVQAPAATPGPTMGQANDTKTNSILWQVAFKGAIETMKWLSLSEDSAPVLDGLMKAKWREYYDILQKPDSLPAHDEDGPMPEFIAKAGEEYAAENEMPQETEEEVPF